jgi:hypothetical protein
MKSTYWKKNGRKNAIERNAYRMINLWICQNLDVQEYNEKWGENNKLYLRISEWMILSPFAGNLEWLSKRQKIAIVQDIARKSATLAKQMGKPAEMVEFFENFDAAADINW